jgi:WD40 repeat protein
MMTKLGPAWLCIFLALAALPAVASTGNSVTEQPAARSTPTTLMAPEIVWDVAGHTRSVVAVAFSRDAEIVASGADYSDNTARLWRAEDGGALGVFPDHDWGVLSVDISPDNRFLAVGYLVVEYAPGGKTKLWDVANDVVVDEFGGGFAAFSPDGEFIATGGGGANRYLYLHRVSTGEQIWSAYTGAYMSAVAYSPDGRIVATAGTDNLVKLWDAQTGELIGSLVGHTDDVTAIAFSPDGRMLASGAGGFDEPGESTIKLWRVSDGALVRTLEGHGEAVHSVEFLPGGQFLVSSGRDGGNPFQTIRFWRVSDGQLVRWYDETAFDIAYSPDGDVFAYGRPDGHVVVARSPLAFDEVLPDGYSIIRGQLLSGGLDDLYESDDSRLSVRAGIILDTSEPPVWLELEGTSPTASPEALRFTLEARAVTSGLAQEIELYNYVTESYEEIDQRQATTEDSVATVFVTGDPSRFVDPETLAMRARLTWKPAGPILLWPFDIGIDQAVWAVTP